jgi:hypothetical protein
LLYPETMTAKWHLPQSNATLHNSKNGTRILQPL